MTIPQETLIKRLAAQKALPSPGPVILQTILDGRAQVSSASKLIDWLLKQADKPGQDQPEAEGIYVLGETIVKIAHLNGVTFVCMTCGEGLLFIRECSIEEVTATLRWHHFNCGILAAKGRRV